MTISLSISHTPWRPERVESLARLDAQLGKWDGPAQLMTDRAPNHEWSAKMWKRAVDLGADWSLFLQDDAQVAPRLRAWLDAMLFALPRRPARWPSSVDVIGLEAVHPVTPLLASAGYRWCTTRDGLVGVGYIVRTSALAEFLQWRATALKPGALERINEDTLIGLWSLVTGRRVWHPLPTPLDHDVSMASTFGNDAHRNRRPLVRWDTWAIASKGEESAERRDFDDPDFWRRAVSSPGVAHLGIFPGWHLPMLARREVIDYTDARAKADLADDGRAVIAPLLPGSGRCWVCLEQPKAAETHVTGCALCRPCVVQVVAALIGARP